MWNLPDSQLPVTPFIRPWASVVIQFAFLQGLRSAPGAFKLVGVMKWPQSKGIQAAIAFAVALLSAGFVFVQISMESFNHFYFPPHKAYPYPYLTEWAARLAMFRDCGLTFLIVFATLYMAQRKFVASRDKSEPN
jgi:hypothetical protein